MFCHRCGNKLSLESAYCNRCGAKVQQSVEEEPRAVRPSIPPPRPARRRPIAPPRPVREYEEYVEEDEYEPEYEEVEYEEEAAPGKSEKEGEEIIFQITPAFYNVALAYLAAILLSVLMTAGAAYVRVPIAGALIVSAVLFIYPIWLHIQNRRVIYTLTSIKVEIAEGIFSQSTRNIPLRHIQDVTVSESFKERLIGIGDMVIDSAAAAGKITMNNINDPRKYADLILNELQYWR